MLFAAASRVRTQTQTIYKIYISVEKNNFLDSDVENANGKLIQSFHELKNEWH